MSCATVTVRETPGVLQVKVEGELDLTAAELLTEASVAVESASARMVVLDLTATSFVDLSGLDAMLALRRQALRTGHRVQFRCGRAAGRVRALLVEHLDVTLCVPPGSSQLSGVSSP